MPQAPDKSAGLTNTEAERRRRQYGANVIESDSGQHWTRRIINNLSHFFALLLWGAAGLALVAGQAPLAIAIVIVIAVNAAFSFNQEFRAEKALDALRRILPPQARVRRDGRVRNLPASEIVPGDTVILASGDRVPADGRLTQASRMRADLSALTGESQPVNLSITETKKRLDSPGWVFAGSHIIAGEGEVLISDTGQNSELGRIARLTKETRLRTSPLEKEISRLARLVGLIALAIGLVFFLVAGLLEMSLNERFIFAIGVIVALVPEGMLPTATLSLAAATQHMAHRQAVVRRLSAVETLGETTVICTDKTGTLTTNEMTVSQIWLPMAEYQVSGSGYEDKGRIKLRRGEETDLSQLARIGLLCNDAELTISPRGLEVVGDPTEGALITLARKAGLHPNTERRLWARQVTIPFSAETKQMATLHRANGHAFIAVKGAPEKIIAQSKLNKEEREQALSAAATMAAEGLRVLALAVKESEQIKEINDRLNFLGLVAMADPPRPEAAAAVQACLDAGIRVLITTGDSGLTAEAVAKRVGLVEGPAQIIEGSDIDSLTEKRLLELITADNAIIARVTPEDKLLITNLLQKTGEVVAMTGDGVNDAPALRAADIGVAMGKSGTDVAREAADIVLLDDNFASVVAAVEEGRGVYDNIRRFAQYHFSANVAELMAFLLWGLSGGTIPLPLVVMQVLAIDIGTDLLPAIALGVEKPDAGVMERKPRKKGDRLLGRGALARVFLFIGPLVGLSGLFAFFWGNSLNGYDPGQQLPNSGTDYLQATAMTYAGIVMAQVGAAFAYRSDRQSLFKLGPLSNRPLVAGIAFAIALMAAIIYLPILEDIFHTRPLWPQAWIVLITLPLIVIGAEEIRKAIARRMTGGH